MADTREKTKDVAGKAPGMAEKAGDQGKQGMHMVSDKTKEATSGVVGALEDKVQDMATSASQLAGKAKDAVEEWASSAGDGVRTFARLLRDQEAADLLQETLDEEEAADKKLTELAETTINVEANEVKPDA